MIQFLILLLIIFWLFGFMGIPFFNYVLVSPFTLNSLVLLILMGLIINLLSGKYRKFNIVLMALWVFSFFGIIGIPGGANLFVLAFIILSVFSVF